MGFINRCQQFLVDQKPERDESHSGTRYGLYEPELPIQPALPPAQDTLDQRFAAFHAAHPEVYEAIRARAFSWAGPLRMKEIYESVRSEMKFSLNNDFTSRYTDLLIEKAPEFEGRFRRRARAKGKMALHYARTH